MLYIINLQNSANTNVVATRLGVSATAKIYENVHMIVVEDSTDQELIAWKADPDVKNIVEDQLIEMEDVSEIETMTVDSVPTTEETFTTNATGDTIQNTLLFTSGGTDYHSWHLDRITKKDPSYMNRQYSYTSDGWDVDLYILDSGVAGADHNLHSGGGTSAGGTAIGLQHSEFIDNNPSFTNNYRVVDGGVPGLNIGNWNNEDTQGHGTYCAQFAAGLTCGLAKKATIWSAKVMDAGGTGSNSGWTSDIIAGGDAVIQHHLTKTNLRASIINISLGMSFNQANTDIYINEPGTDPTWILDEMEINLVSYGIHVARTAGNGIDDGNDDFAGPVQSSFVAGARSSALPANFRQHWNEHDLHTKFSAGATTVAGTTPNATNWPTGYSDEMAYFSNYGYGTTLSAPGHSLIAHSWIVGNGYVSGLAGTSFSCPMIAGMLCLRQQMVGDTPADAVTWVLANAVSTGYITDLHTEVSLDANPLQCLAGEPYILVKVPQAVYNDTKNAAFQLRGATVIDNYSLLNLNNTGHVKSNSVDQVFSIISNITSVPPDGTIIRGTTSTSTATVVRGATDGQPASIMIWCNSSSGPFIGGEQIINLSTSASYGICALPSTGYWLECNMDNMNASATVVNAGGSSVKIGTLYNTHEATDALISVGATSWTNSIPLHAHFDDLSLAPGGVSPVDVWDYFPIDEQANLLLYQPYIEKIYKVKEASGAFMTPTGTTEALGDFALGDVVNKDMSFNHTTWANEPLGAVTSAYSIINGSLPSGLSFDTATAVINGTFTADQTTLFTFTVMNSVAATSQEYSMNYIEGEEVGYHYDGSNLTLPGGIFTKWSSITANTNAVSGQSYFVDTTANVVIITLPGNPTQGSYVRIIDAVGNAHTNKITVAQNGKNIQGIAQDLDITTARVGFTLIFYNDTQGWVLMEN